MLEIKFDNQPEKFLKKCEKPIFDRIISKLKELILNPVPHDSKRIVGYSEPTFRVRIGKYRALYRINHETNCIVVVKIDHREKVY